MKNLKNVKPLLFGIVLVVVFCLMNTNVYAKTMTPKEIQGSSYVIGSHIFTREINEVTGYEGRLTTNLIMYASKSIQSSSLDDMIIYYKTATGIWINGTTGATIEPPTSFEINYTNLQLEEISSTVSAPKTPILYLDGPISIDEETNKVTYQLNIFIDDIEDSNNKVDGVEISIINYNKNAQLECGEAFTTVSTILDSFKADVDGLVVGNKYHSDFITIENTIDGYETVAVTAYVLDDNGKKIYSEAAFVSMSPDTNLPVPTIINEYSNPDYIAKGDGYYSYRLGIEELSAYVFKVKPEKFAYLLSEKTENGWLQLGIYDLSEKVDISVPENSVKVYSAHLGYYDENGNFQHYVTSNTEFNYFTIDTRSLTAPVLSTVSADDNGEYLYINDEFYEKQDEETLDYQIEGTEIYRVYWTTGTSGIEIRYELIEVKFGTTHVFPPDGTANYVARVYAVNAEGKKVYSDFSNIVTVVRKPEIEVSEVIDGEVTVKVANLDEYGYGTKVSYKVYKFDSSNGGEILVEEANSIDEALTLSVTESMKIYIRAYNIFGQDEVYSDESTMVDIVIE